MKTFKEQLEELKKAASKPSDGPAWIVGHWDRDEEGAFICELIRRFNLSEEALNEANKHIYAMYEATIEIGTSPSAPILTAEFKQIGLKLNGAPPRNQSPQRQGA